LGRYGAAKSVYHLALVNRKVLHLPRTDWKVAASEYAKLVMRITTDCARAIERQAGPGNADTIEFVFLIEEAIAHVAEYVMDNSEDCEVKEDLERLHKILRL